MRPRDGSLVRPLLGFTREETTAYCEERGLAGATTRPTTRPATPATASATASLPALAEIHPAAARNVLRTAELLRDEAEVLDSLVDAELRRANGSRAARSSWSASPSCPGALRRLVVQRLADRAAGRPVPGAANHADEVAALRRTGTAMLDLGGGVRAVVERGILRAERPGVDGTKSTP